MKLSMVDLMVLLDSLGVSVGHEDGSDGGNLYKYPQKLRIQTHNALHEALKGVKFNINEGNT